MGWKAFWTEWLQRLLDMFLSVKVLLLLTMVLFALHNVSISTTIATVITTVIGIREGYKVVRSFNRKEGEDRDLV